MVLQLLQVLQFCEGNYSCPLQYAATGDHLEVIKWLDQSVQVSSNNPDETEVFAVEVAAGNGHLDVDQWFTRSEMDQNVHCTVSVRLSRTASSASSSGS